MPVHDYEDIELFDGKSGFLGAIGKIGRARYQLQDLDQRFRAFAEGRPYIVGADSCLCQVAISVATCSGSRLIAVVPGQSRAPRNHSCLALEAGGRRFEPGALRFRSRQCAAGGVSGEPAGAYRWSGRLYHGVVSARPSSRRAG